MLHGTVVLHDVGEVVGGHCSFVYGACIPFAVECVLTVALIDFVLNCHDVFSFLCVLMVLIIRRDFSLSWQTARPCSVRTVCVGALPALAPRAPHII